MPVKLCIHLRYLQPSLPIAYLSTTMKPSSQPIRPSRVIPVLSRIFPHRLKYGPRSLASNWSCRSNNNNAIRKFSTRSGRRSSEFDSGQEVRAVKSLVDDEAELSDWVSGLSSKSFKKTQLYSDSDNDIDKERENDGFRTGRGRDKGMEDSRAGKRRRGSSFEEFSGLSGRDGPRGSEETFSRGRGGRQRGLGRETGWELNERFPGNARGNGRSGGQVKGRSVGSRETGSDLNERFSGNSRVKGRFEGQMEGRREKTKEERDPGHFDGRGMRRGERRGDRRGGKVHTGRGGLVISDDNSADEEEEKGFKSFKELIESDEDDKEDDEEEEEEEDGVLFEKETVLAWRQKEDGVSSPSLSASGSGDSYLTETRFDQFSISPLSMKGLKDVGYEKMTVVQEATLPVILKGKDVLAKARTGTGKTVAFLLPSIEAVVKTPPASRDERRPPILVLVVCPTRELACQAAAEANKLLKYHSSLGVQVVIGGTRLSLEQKRMQANPCQVLVATPGRLKDHIENTAGFATRLMGVKVLVLDEADHLLDMGFRKDIERIIAAVPKQRQTLLFSATVPQEVRQICHIALKRDHEYINTVQEGSEETHTQVRQTHLIAPLDNHFPLLYTLMKEHIADNVDYKVLVFCTTAMVTRLVAELLCELNLNVREIHSRKSQSYRTKVSDEFRKSKGLILVTSDVSARGVDYPDVTLVVQLGLPADRQQYIHRLGRTGRKGKEGQGVLLLAPWEEFFLSTIKDLPISKAPIPLVDPETRKKVERALSHVGMKEKESAYQAWLGYYNSNKNVGRDKCRLVELANEFSRTMGLDNPPAIPKLVLGKMGLRNIPGLRSK